MTAALRQSILILQMILLSPRWPGQIVRAESLNLGDDPENSVPKRDASYEIKDQKSSCDLSEQTCSMKGSDTCRLWLAPSSIPGAGMGAYSGVDLEVNEQVQQTGDIVIPIMDIATHHIDRYSNWYFSWDSYSWQGDALGPEFGNEGHSSVFAASPGK